VIDIKELGHLLCRDAHHLARIERGRDQARNTMDEGQILRPSLGNSRGCPRLVVKAGVLDANHHLLACRLE
jgi:hypothetical protein